MALYSGSTRAELILSQGILTLEPGSTNVTPGMVKFTVDARHPSSEALEKMERAMQTESRQIAEWHSEKGCSVEWTRTTISPEVVFDDVCVQAVKDAGVEAAGPDMVREMFSGAGHDS